MMNITAAIGHNNGPTMEQGKGWRTHCWTQARKSLLGHLPIEIVRGQVKRAAEIGLDYKTYATVTGTSGRDVIAFLFSSNALRLHLSAADLPGDRAQKLRDAIKVDHLIAAHRPIDPARLPAEMAERHAISIRAARRTPAFSDSWSAMRDHWRQFLLDERLNPASVVLIGDTALEREWSAAGKFAAYLTADRYFPESTAP